MPAVQGYSAVTSIPGVYGGNTAQGDGVFGGGGDSGRGVVGVSVQRFGVDGTTTNGIAVLGGVMEGGRGRGVVGIARTGSGVEGYSTDGVGVVGRSTTREGVYAETESTQFAAVAGISLNLKRDRSGAASAGVWGFSRAGEGVHGESYSDVYAAVTGIQRNRDSKGAGIYGEHWGSGPAGFFNGNVVVKGDIELIDADCAEDFDIINPTSDPDQVSPGTVMVIDPGGALRPSDQCYDQRVAGVISGAGGYKPGIILDKQHPQGNRMPIALLGKVFCKVDAQDAPIEVVDLLTTSATPGHAMKSADPTRAFGTVLGKALRPLKEGKGLIPILVALQ